MNTYIVYFKTWKDSPWCTNVAKAEDEADVHVEYEECYRVHIGYSRDCDIDALIARGCPVVECPPSDRLPERCFDRRYASVYTIDSHHDEVSGDDYDLVCSEDDLYLLVNVEGCDTGDYLFYDECVAEGNNRYVLERWHMIVG